MINLVILREKVADSGIPITRIARRCGVSRQTIYRKLDGSSPITVDEAIHLCEALRLTTEERDLIFFNGE